VRVGGRFADLTALEFDLLTHLVRQPKRAYTREQLLREVWHQSRLGDPSAVTVLVRRLGEKIEDFPSRPCRLLTVYGVGYRLNVPPTSATGADADRDGGDTIRGADGGRLVVCPGRDAEVRKRVTRMWRIFQKYQGSIAAVSIVARKPLVPADELKRLSCAYPPM